MVQMCPNLKWSVRPLYIWIGFQMAKARWLPKRCHLNTIVHFVQFSNGSGFWTLTVAYNGAFEYQTFPVFRSHSVRVQNCNIEF